MSALPSAPPRGVVVLHGFTGTPFEVRPLSERLERAGYEVETPVLAGHGGDLASLEATGWRDWFSSAEEAFDRMAARMAARGPGRIAVVGFSMGGLLALRLAQTRAARVAGLAVLAAPLRLRAAQVRGIRLLSTLPRVLRRGPLRAVPKFFGSDVSIPELKRNMPGVNALPLTGLRSLLELMAVVRNDLAALATLRLPVLVAHGRNDRAVPIADSYELAELLQGERLWLERSSHLVGVDVERQLLAEAIVTFFEERGRW